MLHLWESQALAIRFCDQPSLVSHSRFSTEAPVLHSLSTLCEPMYSGLQTTSLWMSYRQFTMFLPVLGISQCLKSIRACDLPTVGVTQRSNSITLSWLFISPIVVLDIASHWPFLNVLWFDMKLAIFPPNDDFQRGSHQKSEVEKTKKLM